MYQTKVSYQTFSGETVTEDLHFNINTVELAKLGGSVEGGDYQAHLMGLMSGNNPMAIINSLIDVLLLAYGKPTADGRGFYKSPELKAEFENSLAFAAYVEELLTDEAEAMRFGQQTIAASKVLKEGATKAAGSITIPEMATKSTAEVLQFNQPKESAGEFKLTDEEASVMAVMPTHMQLDYIEQLKAQRGN